MTQPVEFFNGLLDVFDYFAFLVIAVLLATAVVIVVLLGSLPGRIAASRKHPYAAAINAAGWISLITLGALWPIAFIWAFVPPRTGSGPAADGGPTA